MLPVEENQAAEIDGCCHYDEIGSEERCDFGLGDSTDHYNHREYSASQRNKPQIEQLFRSERKVEAVYYGEIRDGEQEKQPSCAQVMAPVVHQEKFYEKVSYKDYARPQLKSHIALIVKKINPIECVH